VKYVMLIHQGTTPLPGSPKWDQLPEVEQAAVYADYQAINQDPAVTPGLPLGRRTRPPCACRTASP
jgi:hypothetical protein